MSDDNLTNLFNTTNEFEQITKENLEEIHNNLRSTIATLWLMKDYHTTRGDGRLVENCLTAIEHAKKAETLLPEM